MLNTLNVRAEMKGLEVLAVTISGWVGEVTMRELQREFDANLQVVDLPKSLSVEALSGGSGLDLLHMEASETMNQCFSLSLALEQEGTSGKSTLLLHHEFYCHKDLLIAMNCKREFIVHLRRCPVRKDLPTGKDLVSVEIVIRKSGL